MVFQIGMSLAKAMLILQLRQPAMLQVHVVVVVEGIKAMHRMALAEQCFCDMKTDKAGMAGHENAQ